MSKIIFIVFVLLNGPVSLAQDGRAQYPKALINSYLGVNLGYVNYSFSSKQLEPGFTAASIHVPHAAVEVFFGHRFNKYLSAQISYLRPVYFVEYKNVNGSGHDFEVGMNILSLTIKPALPVSKNITIDAEAGAAIVTRGGFIFINTPGVKDEAYASLLLGGGVAWELTKKWRLTLNTKWSPVNKSVRQSATVFYSAGFNYTMLPLPKEKVDRNASSGFIFPKQLAQVGYTTNALGYGFNEFVSKDAHIFWGGAARVAKGFSLNYQRNIFHTRKVFSLDWGAGFSYLKSELDQGFYTIAVYPLFRFSFLRSRTVDVYFDYSLAGPAFISATIIDGKDAGEKFSFQDMMGIGLFAGKKKRLNAEIRIAHYSNGNIFPQNNGVMIPFTFCIGYSFN